MSGAERTLVIVGGGLAGAKAAEGARVAGFEGRVVLVGEEAELPYERPPLSKAVLRGEDEPEKAFVHDADFFEAHRIELITGRAATGVDVAARQVVLDGDRLPFDRLVLATGAAPRRLTVPGGDLVGVHSLRTMADAGRLGRAIGGGARVAVVGAGWIGCEVAASARQMGADVVMIDPAPTPLHRVLGPEIGDVFARLHADHGVKLRLGVGVTSLVGGVGGVEGVVLTDGSTEPADVVVAGIGVTPRTELAEAAGLAVDDGIVVDLRLQTGVPGIFAAGDVARAWHPHYERHVRVEHWANAVDQGTAAGRNAAGAAETYDRLPYFFSDQFDLGMEYVGLAGDDDGVVVRGDVDARKFVAYWHDRQSGVVNAAMHVNTWDAIDGLKAAVSDRVSIGEVA